MNLELLGIYSALTLLKPYAPVDRVEESNKFEYRNRSVRRALVKCGFAECGI